MSFCSLLKVPCGIRQPLFKKVAVAFVVVAAAPIFLFQLFSKKGLTNPLPLAIILKYEIRRHGQVVRHGSAKPSSPVRIRVAPPNTKRAPVWVLFLRLGALLARRIAFSCATCKKTGSVLPRNRLGACSQAASVQIFAQNANGG